MSYRIGPGVPRSLSELSQFVHREFGAIQREAVRVDTKAQNALEDLTLISDDGKLHPNEKLQVVLRYAQLTGEQAGIEARADAYGITTEKTAYTTAISDLSDYLNGLNPLWTDVTQVTPIDRAEWNSYWVAVTDARQVLQNKIAERAGEEAKWSSVANDNGQRPEDGATVGATTEQVQTLNAAANPYANLLRNPTAERGLIFWEPPGGGVVEAYSGSNGEGTYFHFGTANNQTLVMQSEWFRLSEYVQLTCSADMFSAGLSAGNFVMDFSFADVNYNSTGGSNRSTSPPGSGWQRRSFTQTSPAGTYWCRVRVFLEGATNTSSAIKRIMVNGGAQASPYQDTLGMERDQRNLGQVIGSVQAGTAQNALSAADVGSFPRISIAAHVVQYGDFSVSYNSGSIDVSLFNTKYYVYVDDPDYKGGAVTYLTSTNPLDPIKKSGRRYLGTITTPSNGGGSSTGNPPGADCPVAGTWLRHDLKVDDLRVGDVIDCWDDGCSALFPQTVRYVRRVDNVPSVLLTTASGAQKEVSAETPITTEDGRSVLAMNALGERVAAQRDGQPLGWEEITDVADIGPQTVYHINVGGISLAGGVDPARRIVTHNAYKP